MIYNNMNQNLDTALQNQIFEFEDEKTKKNFQKAFEHVKNVLSANHHLNDAQKAAYPVQSAIVTNDRVIMINTLTKYLNEYRTFIDSTSNLTNTKVIDVPLSYFDDKENELIIDQLEFVKTIVYFKTATNFGFKKVVDTILKKIFELN